MNTFFSFFKKAFLILLLIGMGSLKAQFVNGNFNSGSAPTTITSWGDSSCQYVPAFDPITPTEDAWIDMTGTGFGVGEWMQQSVYTSPCKLYQVSFDLSAWNSSVNGWDFWDAGIIVAINGVTLGGPVSVADFSGHPLSWHRMHTITFRGSGTYRFFRFTGSTNFISGTTGSGCGVIGFDNVALDSFPLDYQDSFTLVASADTGCNEYCFDISRLMEDEGGSFSNIFWTFDGDTIQEGGTTHCRKFGKSLTPQTVYVEFDYTDATGCIQHLHYSKSITPNKDCPCNFDQHMRLITTYHPCDQYEFKMELDAGYETECIHWTIDGVKVTDGSLRTYEPGHHKVCVIAIGHAMNEAWPACCATQCYEFDIPVTENSMILKSFCELTASGYLFDPCTEYPGYMFYELSTGSGFYSGPCPTMPIMLPEGLNTLNLYDADHCLRKIVTINVTRQFAAQTMCDLGILHVNCFPATYNLDSILYTKLHTIPPPPCHCDGDSSEWYENGNPSPIYPGLPYMFNPGVPHTFTKVIYDRLHCRKCVYSFTVLCQDGVPPPQGNKQQDGHTGPRQDMQDHYKIIPNPTSSVFQVATNAGYEKYKAVEIQDINGKVIFSKTDVDSDTYFDLRSFPAGTYIVTVSTEQGQITLKLLTL